MSTERPLRSPATLRSLADKPPWRPDHIVAHDGEGTVSWARLRLLTDTLFESVSRINTSCVRIEGESGVELAAALLACWRLGRIPVLSASNRAQSTPALTASHNDAAVAGIHLPDTTLAGVVDAALILFTSGSSGSPVTVVKTFSQLDAELAILEACWGPQVDGSVFATTVSRRHMYGLPFSLLWPLARGSAFYSRTIHYSQSLEGLCRHFPLTLVSSPVQLDNLPDNLEWPTLRSGLVRIFSAGAPLPAAAAQTCRQKLLPVIEIYGSTETGAVAWRDQTRDPMWECLPGIAVTADADHLRVSSPCLEQGRLTVADRAQVTADGRFRLLGRADRIAKVGGKRISLAEVEKRLTSHPWVGEARTTLLEARKSRIGAVVVLTAEGRAALIDRGRGDLNRLLATHVAPGLEPVAIPRYWRYVGQLPLNPQGKVTNALLQSLFHPERQPRLPEILEEHEGAEDNARSLVLRVPHDLFYFFGHFPGNPVLPGVVQLAWAEHFAACYFGELAPFQRVERLKFQQIIQPGDVVTLTLAWTPGKQQLQFDFSGATARHSSGRLVYGGTHG